MGIFSLLGLVLSAVLGMVGTAATNQQNKQNADDQLQKQQDFSHNEAELANERALENYWQTQSPQSRVQQIKDAGLSVGLMYGGAGNGGVNVTSQAQTPSANLPIMQNPLQGGLNDMFENMRKLAETENLGQDTEKKKAEIDEIKSNIEVNNATITKIATENNLTEVMTANAKLDGTIKQVEAEIAENTKQNQIDIVATQLENMKKEGEKMLQEINGLNIDNQNKQDIYDATLNKMKAETALLWKQVAKTEAEKWMVKATTALTTEQTELTWSQKQKTLKEIQNFKQLMAKVEAETELLLKQGEKIQLEKVTEIIGWINQLAQISDKIMSAVWKAAFIPK